MGGPLGEGELRGLAGEPGGPAGAAGGRAHSVPCRLGGSGPAEVAGRFEAPAAAAAGGSGGGGGAGAGARAALRGRQLRGRDLELPAGTVAARLRGGAGGAGLEVAQVLGRVVLWNHDAEVSPADPLPRAVEWLGMAEAVHGPVRLEEVEAALAEEPAAAPAA